MFSDLFRTYQLLPAFWDLISSFGYKNDDSDTYFGGCFTSLGSRSQTSVDEHYGCFVVISNNKSSRLSNFLQIYATTSDTYVNMAGEKVILGYFATSPYIND